MRTPVSDDPISFIMPCFRCAATVEASVASIVNGNLRAGDEIVLVEDGSGDDTWAVLQRLADRHPQIRVLGHDMNRGGAAARNTAVRNARHDLLFCLDSDNILRAGSVGRLLTHLKQQSADVAAFGELWYFLNDLHRVTHRWRFQETVTLADCFAGIVVPPSSGNYLFTRASWEAAAGYPEGSGAVDTWGFGVRQLAAGARMVTLPRSYYLHRYGHESYWIRDSRDGRVSDAAARVVETFQDRFPEASFRVMTEAPTRDTWFESLDRNPLALNEGLGRAGNCDKPFPRWWQRPLVHVTLRGLASA